MESHKTEEVVEKRVARSVIRRRKHAADPAEEMTAPAPEPQYESVVKPRLVEQTQDVDVAVVQKTSAPAEVNEVKKLHILGQVNLRKDSKKIVDQPATAVQAPVKEKETEKRAVTAVKTKAFEEEQKELRKNLTFKDRLQGTIALDKLRTGKAGKAASGQPSEEGEGVAGEEGEVSEEEAAKKAAAKKEKIAKHRKVKNIGGDLDIDGGGKITTLTHLVRTNVLDRVFRPGSKMAAKNRRKVIARKKTKSTAITLKKASKRVVEINGLITVAGLAQQLGAKTGEIIKKLMDLGVMATINQNIDMDTVTLIAREYDYTVRDVSFKENEILKGAETTAEEDEAGLQLRPPVVTIMGHVDHGKTSLLDAIRETSVTEQEAGGITQHIGAYTVDLPQGKITFLDTPGHAAFTSMRARGANVTDIVVLVVAADDGIMPQTEESIAHAQAAGVPIIVAINKMDKPDAKPDVVLRQLSEKGLLVEEWGGEVLAVKVSALKQSGIKELLESILLQSEVLELKSNPDKPVVGTILEAQLDKGRGPVATLLVQEGTLKLGDAVVAGDHAGRIRAMYNWKGEKVETAGPSTAVEVLGLEGLPLASDPFNAVATEQDAKKIVEHRLSLKREASAQKGKAITLEDMFSHLKAGQVKEFNFILKTDVQGSLEAIEQVIAKMGNEEVKARVIYAGVGAIRDSDVNLAAASKAVIIGFHVRPETMSIHLAKEKGVEIKLYKIIYELVDEVKLALSGLLAPTRKESYLGRAEVREVFQVSKIGMIAGCMVVDGLIQRNAKLRLLRDNIVIHEGDIASLKRFKDDAREVKQGFDCGVGISGYQDIKAGDVIEAYIIEEIKRSL